MAARTDEKDRERIHDMAQRGDDLGGLREAPSDQVPVVFSQAMAADRPQGAIEVAVHRDEQKVLQKLKIIATAAGDDFYYSWPVKNKDGTKGTVEGATVKCANAVMRVFGNCSVQLRAFELSKSHWIIYARFYDMETGLNYERPFIQRKAQNIGAKMDAERAQDIVFQIGCSKAARNAVTNSLGEFTDYCVAVAKEQLVEKIGKNMAGSLDKVKRLLADLNIDLKRVEAVRGNPIEKWTAYDIARTVGELNSAAEGMMHPDDLWPLPETGQPRPEAPKETAGQVKTEADKPDSEKPADASKAKPDAKTAGLDASKGVENASNAPQAPKEGATDASAGRPAQAEPEPQPAQESADGAEDARGNGSEIEQTEDDVAAEVFSRAERMLEALKKGDEGMEMDLPRCQTPEDVDKLKSRIREEIAEIEGLSAEDKAVLQGRWNTMCLERTRERSRRRPK